MTDQTVLLKGQPVSKHIREKLKSQIFELKETHNITPKLAAILVGDDPASQVYVSSKGKTFKKMDCASVTYCLPADIPEDDLIIVRLGDHVTRGTGEEFQGDFYHYIAETYKMLNNS